MVGAKRAQDVWFPMKPNSSQQRLAVETWLWQIEIENCTNGLASFRDVLFLGSRVYRSENPGLNVLLWTLLYMRLHPRILRRAVLAI